MLQDPVIASSALASLGAFHFLDVRSPDAFEKGHAPGAIRVPIAAWEAAARAAETSLDTSAYWEDAICRLGLDPAVPAVVGDDGRMTDAARVWFILQYFGVKALVLNGGWPTLSGYPDCRAGIRPAVPTTAFRAHPGTGPVGLINRTELKGDLSKVHILDARTSAEFSGEDLRQNTRGGHLPGARLLPHADLLGSGGLKPVADLHALLSAAGFGPGDHVVTHCDGGGRAALAALAALRAGYDDVRVYYLSFADWAKDESCPIVPDEQGPA